MVDVDVEIGLNESEDVLRTKAFQVVKAMRPEWRERSLFLRRFSDGITNLLVGVGVEKGDADDLVLLRIYGQGTDLLIDRSQELAIVKHFQSIGKGPRFFGTFANGLAYAFVAGRVATVDSIRGLHPLVASAMAEQHSIRPQLPNMDRPCLWSWTEKLLGLAPKTIDNEDVEKQKRYRDSNVPSKSELREWVEFAKKHVISNGPGRVVFCHNDLLLCNIIYDESKGSVAFIDHEYGDYNYEAFDLANHFAEFVGVGGKLDFENGQPDAQFRRQFIAKYLEALEGSDSRLTELEKCVELLLPMPHLVWGIWGLVQSATSTIDFDFVDYAGQKLNEFKRLRQIHWKK